MTTSAFADLPLTPRDHFRVCYHAAVFHLVAAIRGLRDDGDLDLHAVLDRHPFLDDYLTAAVDHLPAGLAWVDAPAWWRTSIRTWEAGAPAHLPLVALERLGLGFPERLAVLVSGLVEEDPRFGSVIAELQRPVELRRPTLSTVAGIVGLDTDAWSLRASLVLPGLLDGGAGLPEVDAPVRVPAELWAVLRGEPDHRLIPWAEHLPADRLTSISGLVLTDEVRERAGRAHAPLSAGRGAAIVSGPAASGRRRLLGALARSAGLGALFADSSHLDAARWRLLGPLGVALGAMPVVRYDATPGRAVEVTRPAGYDGPLGIAVTAGAGLEGTALDGAVRLELPRLGPDERRRHWKAALVDVPIDDQDLNTIAERFVLPEGHLRRLARRAQLGAQLAGRSRVGVADVAEAKRTLNRQRLDGLARRLEPLRGWSRLVTDDATRELLVGLEVRCRQRERLLDHLSDGFGATDNIGVRALIGGPSGTGKTLAARILAAELDTDVYRVDVAAIVDKYVGETEKNLDRVLSGAEELDVVLLIDEGDSLLGARTEVRSANDRFANLETNFLLQRLETYQGVVLVTTNAEDRIDPAFHRRMDAVLHLVEPGPPQRREIWDLHLPCDHTIPDHYLDDLADRAELTGGQIRNAAMQAVLAALDECTPLDARHLDRAVAGEYGKAGAVSPFQRTAEVRRLRRSDAFLEALP